MANRVDLEQLRKQVLNDNAGTFSPQDASPFIGIAWQIVKPIFEAYLKARGLVIPQARLAQLAKQVGISLEDAEALQALVDAEIIAEIDKIKL